MASKADLLNRGSGLNMDDDASGNKSRPMPGKSRPGPSKPGQKRSASQDASSAPDAKKLRTDSKTGEQLDELMRSLSQFDESARKNELRAWAEITVHQLPMGDLNYYLQSIKKMVEKKRQRGTADHTYASGPATNGRVEPAKQIPKHQSKAGGPPAATTSQIAPPSPSDGEGSHDGNAPTLTGAFYPMQHLDKGENKKPEEEKAFKRPKAEKRSAEEEQQYQDLLHSIHDNPVIVEDVLQEGRFDEVITESLSLCKKLKDWFSVWSNCAIKGAVTVDACVYLTNRLCQTPKDDEEISDIVGHLMKEKEISPKHMEDSIKRLDVGGRQLHIIIGHILVFIYPTSKGDFGWSRVGWGFAQWWAQCKKYVKDLEKPMDAMKLIVDKLVEYQADFKEEKQEKLICWCTEHLMQTREAVCELLSIQGSAGGGAQPSPSPLSSDPANGEEQ